MKARSAPALGAAMLCGLTAMAAAQGHHETNDFRPKTFVAPNRTCRALVRAIRDHAGADCFRVTVRQRDGRKLWSYEYAEAFTSARWSRDSRYFVFAAHHLAGHHPWEAYVHVYDLRLNRVEMLNDRGLRCLDDTVRFTGRDSVAFDILDWTDGRKASEVAPVFRQLGLPSVPPRVNRGDGWRRRHVSVSLSVLLRRPAPRGD